MELAMPPKVTAEMAKGFTLYMVKALLNGRADEIVELARSNLRRRRRDSLKHTDTGTEPTVSLAPKPPLPQKQLLTRAAAGFTARISSFNVGLQLKSSN